jgi:hypothetical protein
MPPSREKLDAEKLALARGWDAFVGPLGGFTDNLIDVKFGVDALRTLRAALMQVAYRVGAEPKEVTGRKWRALLVLADSPLTLERIQDEWEQAVAVLQPKVTRHITICLAENKSVVGIPHELDASTQSMIASIVAERRQSSKPPRTDFGFIIRKLLLHRWLTNGGPLTSELLAKMAGCSYPAVKRALESLGSLIERESDRRVTLGFFPEEEFTRMIALAPRARSTVRFATGSVEPRSQEATLRRLQKLDPPGVAIGGVMGARHYYAELDIVGSPRLDLSVHCPGRHMDLNFLMSLDPALTLVTDPLEPATLVVHAVRHEDSLFKRRDGGLAWADRVDCLLDLHEARLDAQADEFLEYLLLEREKLHSGMRDITDHDPKKEFA